MDKTIFVKGTNGHTVRITVYDEDGNVSVTTAMTEITTTGVFRYVFSASVGVYYAVMLDTTNSRSMGSQTIDLSDTPTSSEIADAVWDEILSGHTVSGSAGKIVKTIKDFISVVLAQVL